MKTKLVVLLFGAFLSFSAVAQNKPQFLGDRHVARGVQCQVCHGDKISAQLKEDDQRHEPCVQCHGFYDKVAQKNGTGKSRGDESTQSARWELAVHYVPQRSQAKR